jgi:pimeloyl-ACP methyl ester carboxylesterase
MSVFVLVYGGFMGGWVWRQVAQFLRTAGHEVFAPTLTGFGERGHLANPSIDLNTHIQDIVGVLECEDLEQVILVGYSYGGLVITGVAEKAPERLSCLVYLDVPFPRDGQSVFDLEPEIVPMFLESAREKGDGWRVMSAANPPRWQPQPLKTLTQPLEVKNPAAIGIPRAFIHCTIRPENHRLNLAWPALDRAAEEAKKQGWWYREIEADHGVVFSKPKEVSEILLTLSKV